MLECLICTVELCAEMLALKTKSSDWRTKFPCKLVGEDMDIDDAVDMELR